MYVHVTASSHTAPPLTYSLFSLSLQALPDLVPDLSTFQRSLQNFPYISRIPMYYLTCAHEEKCLSSSADGKTYDHYRHLLRFTSRTMNWGTVDFLPNLRPHEWIWHTCHNHYHSFEAFVHYDLLNVTTRKKVAEGHKASFCLEDSVCRGGYSRYRCGTGTQGISANCGDVYGSHLDCQWIDVTDVPIGTYILRQHVNPIRLAPEADYRNNAVECTVQIFSGFYLYAHSCKLSGEQKMVWHVRPYTEEWPLSYIIVNFVYVKNGGPCSLVPRLSPSLGMRLGALRTRVCDQLLI